MAGREHTSCFSLGCSLQVSLSYIYLGMPAASVVGRDEVLLRPPTLSCCMSVLMLYCPIPDIPCASDHPHMAYNGEVACIYPRHGQIAGSCNTARDQSGLCTSLP